MLLDLSLDAQEERDELTAMIKAAELLALMAADNDLPLAENLFGAAAAELRETLQQRRARLN